VERFDLAKKADDEFGIPEMVDAGPQECPSDADAKEKDQSLFGM
jgi:hypothetical protein